MGNESNDMVKKMLQKLCSQIIKNKEYSTFVKVKVFFVFGSKHKTAMCDYVYGLKIISKNQLRDNYLINKLQSDIKEKVETLFGFSPCCTDIMYEKE
jgi:hypothetical protein